MRVNIDIEGHPSGLAEALKFARTHVIVSRAHLRKVARLAKKHGIYAELKALGVEQMAIDVIGEPRPKPSRR